jgi:hypothetical protein
LPCKTLGSNTRVVRHFWMPRGHWYHSSLLSFGMDEISTGKKTIGIQKLSLFQLSGQYGQGLLNLGYSFPRMKKSLRTEVDQSPLWRKTWAWRRRISMMTSPCQRALSYEIFYFEIQMCLLNFRIITMKLLN